MKLIGVYLLIAIILWIDYASGSNSTKKCKRRADNCSPDKDGLIIPCWRPFEVGTFYTIVRGIIYVLALIYMFLGVSIVSDRFMTAIEVITSQKRTIRMVRDNGEQVTIQVRIWNETVANLTLMALGSSCPEILLSIIEVFVMNFASGDLGPGTIVGSAAFNLFVITAICVYAIPDGETRRIEHLRVFVCTATWSVLAYVWLYIIISISTPERVDWWEGMLTFLFFPILVILAYWTDKRIYLMRFLDKKYTARLISKEEGRPISPVSDATSAKLKLEKQSSTLLVTEDNQDTISHLSLTASMQERQYREYVDKQQQLRRRYIEIREKLEQEGVSPQKLDEEATLMWLKETSRTLRRSDLIRRFTGSGGVRRSAHKQHMQVTQADRLHLQKEVPPALIMFESHHYVVLENVGSFDVNVLRKTEKESSLQDLKFFTYVDFKTVEGTALAVTDFCHIEGTLTFPPGSNMQKITINIVDDDIFEEDEHFTVELFNIRNKMDPDSNESTPDFIDCRLLEPPVATVTILDDDHRGVFGLEQEVINVSEYDKFVRVKVNRTCGARGLVRVPFILQDGKAKGGGIDYCSPKEMYLEFENNITEGIIEIQIVNRDEVLERSDEFYVILLDPESLDEEDPKSPRNMTKAELIAAQGKPRLKEDATKCEVVIHENERLKKVLDVEPGDLAGTDTWQEQFYDAVRVTSGDVDDDGNEEPPNALNYIMHVLTFFWKVLFAFIPPTSYLGGWLCFTVSILLIGVLTAIIGDLASHFGCTVGFKDSMTAITMVAFGTSVPDTFASKVAAVQDETADASIGNVTGSNAVNVFLGIGIAWTLAAFYHLIKDTPDGFAVDPGTLAFSVTVFCGLAIACIIFLFLRRSLSMFGNAELGGPKVTKIISSVYFLLLWVIYIVMSGLVAYCFIEGF